MTVYVDDMHAVPMGQFRRMKMSHMIADTEAELHDMAEKIGVARRWYQGDHYDVCMSKRTLAVKLGAVEIPLRSLSIMATERRRTGVLPPPSKVERIIRERINRRRTDRPQEQSDG